MNNDTENIFRCAGCPQINVNGVWGPNAEILNEEELLECPTVVCPQCQPKKQ